MLYVRALGGYGAFTPPTSDACRAVVPPMNVRSDCKSPDMPSGIRCHLHGSPVIGRRSESYECYVWERAMWSRASPCTSMRRRSRRHDAVHDEPRGVTGEYDAGGVLSISSERTTHGVASSGALHGAPGDLAGIYAPRDAESFDAQTLAEQWQRPAVPLREVQHRRQSPTAACMWQP